MTTVKVNFSGYGAFGEWVGWICLDIPISIYNKMKYTFSINEPINDIPYVNTGAQSVEECHVEIVRILNHLYSY